MGMWKRMRHKDQKDLLGREEKKRRWSGWVGGFADGVKKDFFEASSTRETLQTILSSSPRQPLLADVSEICITSANHFGKSQEQQYS